ncbi:MAG TPA: S4 domain-containing protein, partial [Sphingobium sp.]|nr:S4 domain-containing protein [Sphingobium sp.]
MEDGDSTIDTCIADGQAGMRLDRALADLLPDFSRERVKALILGGHVRGGDGQAARDPAAKVRAGLRYA